MNLLRNKKLLFIFAFMLITILAIIFVLMNNMNKSNDNDTKENSILKQKDITTISDGDLVYIVMEWMWSKFNSGWSNEFEVISSLPKPCQDIYSVYTIEGEVNNGGFNQCYFNSSSQFTKMAESGFQAIGAEGFADIMIRANLTYAEIKDDLEKYDDGTLESFSESYENNPLNALDEEFIRMYENEQLEKLYVSYIRANSKYFGD